MVTSSSPQTPTLLVTFTGRDRPGLTATIFAALAEYPVHILDIEQVTARGKLVLALVITQPSDDARLRATLEHVAATLGLDAEVSAGRGDAAEPGTRAHVTVLGSPLRPAAIEMLSTRIAGAGANIDRIMRLASYPITSIELEVSGADPERLKAELTAEALAIGVDVAVQPSGLIRRSKRLVVMDVDSTLVQGEVVEMLAARAGVLEQVAKVTDAAMRGELDFAESLRARVRLLAGLPESVLPEVRDEVRLTPGARTLVRTLKRLDYRCGIVSGGFSQVTDALAADLGLDFAAANTLEVVDGRLTGELVGPILDRAGKAAALRRFAAAENVPLSQTIAIGDGANDLDMIAAAGLGVAFNAKPVVQDAADTAVNVPYLDAVLYLLGISRSDVEAADAADGLTTPAPPVTHPES